MSVAYHELGHNLGLYHAATPGFEYGEAWRRRAWC
jgi:hypothetical protein